MRTRAALSGIFASAAILVVGWQAGAAVIHDQAASTSSPAPTAITSGGVTPTATPSSAATAMPTAAPSASARIASPAPSQSSTTKTGTAKSGSFTGASESTPYGNVQVQLTLVSGKITEVLALQLTNDGGRSVQISNRAAPVLRSEVLASQTANVASVTGATYTSDGYLSSVQSALDQAGI